MTIWRMHITSWINKATNITDYITRIPFPLQQWLHESFSTLRFTQLACLVYLWDTQIQIEKCCFPVPRCKPVKLLVILGEEIRSLWTVMIMVTTMMMCYSICWRGISFFCWVVCTGVNGPCSTVCTRDNTSCKQVGSNLSCTQITVVLPPRRESAFKGAALIHSSENNFANLVPPNAHPQCCLQQRPTASFRPSTMLSSVEAYCFTPVHFQRLQDTFILWLHFTLAVCWRQKKLFRNKHGVHQLGCTFTSLNTTSTGA